MRIEPKAYKIIAISVLISISYTIALEIAITLLDIKERFSGPSFKTVFGKIFSIILLGPILETIIIQVIPYYLMSIFLEKVSYFRWIYIVTVGLLFAISHHYSQFYILAMAFPGMFLCYMFVYFKERFAYPITYVILIHALHNAIALGLDYLE